MGERQGNNVHSFIIKVVYNLKEMWFYIVVQCHSEEIKTKELRTLYFIVGVL